MSPVRRPPQGFTLLELSVALAIAAILAALATVGVFYGVGRARLGNGVFQAASFFATARMRGQSTGLYEYAVVYQTATESGLRLIESKTAYTLADWQGVTGGNTPPEQDGNPVTVIDSLPISRGGFGFYPLADLAAPPAPFQAVPHTAAASTPSLLAACSFCVGAANGSAVGVIRFDPDQTISFPTADTVGGGALAFGVSGSRDESRRPKVLAISAPFGALKVYDGVVP